MTLEKSDYSLVNKSASVLSIFLQSARYLPFNFLILIIHLPSKAL